MIRELADPVVILVLQVIIAAVSVIASFWVANYRGEMAATKYTLNETRRREHALMLVAEPIQSLKGSLRYIEQIFQVGTTSIGELYQFKVDIHARKSPESEFLFEHLNTGYSQLWQAICRYQDSYNKIADQVLATYRRALDLLEQRWIETDLLTVAPSPKIYAARAVEAFSKEVTSRLVYENEPRFATIQGSNIIMVYSTNIQTMSERDADEIVRDINSILEDPKVFGQLKQLWEEARPLHKERKQIDIQLERIRAFAQAGIFLQGSCTAGRKAHYE